MWRRSRSLIWFALAWSLVTAPDSGGQAPNWRFFKRDADGLPSSPPTWLAFSPAGNLWISHEDGRAVTRFDGYRFSSLTPPGGAKFRVHEGAAGQLWTLDVNGLQFNGGNGWELHPVTAIATEIQSRPARMVRQIPLLPVERQSVLVLLYDRLIKYDALSRQAILIKRSDEAGIGQFSEMTGTESGDLWITGERGAARVKGGMRDLAPTVSWETFALEETADLRGLRAPVPDGSGGISVLGDSRQGNRRVLVRLRDGQWILDPVPEDGLRHCWSTPDGRSWGLDVSALYQWQPPADEARRMDDLGLVPGNLSDIALEPGGAFWISTTDGIWRYSPPVWRPPVAAPRTIEAVTAIHETDDGTLYFLGETELVSLAGETWDRHALPPSPDPPVGLGGLPDGRLYFTDARGLVAFDPGTGSFEQHLAPGGRAELLGTGPAGPEFRHLSAVGGQSLVTFRDGSFQPSQLGPPPDDLGAWTTLTVARSNVIWLGARNGLATWQDGTWTSFPQEEQLLQRGGVRVITETQPGVIWVGGADRVWTWDGRYLLDLKTDTETVHEMVATSAGRIWIASENGLHHLATNQWIELSAPEGVPAGVLTVHEDRNGRVWIGHRRGLARFHPETDPDPPQAIIDGVPANKQISEPVFTVSFTGRDRWNLAPPGRLLFSYRIDGGEWSSFSTADRVTLASSALKAGDRLFEVRAMDRHFNIDQRPALWQFTILTPWFKDPRLMGITALAAIAVVVLAGVAVNRHLRLRRSYAEIEGIVQERTRQLEQATRQLAHAEKMRSLGTLAAGVAHDFNSILSIIRGSTQIIEANPDNPEKIRTRLSRIKSMVEQGSTLVKAMLGFSRADDTALQLPDVAAVVRDTVPLLGDRLPPEVTVKVETADGLPIVHGSRELLQQMLLNLVFNAIDAMEGAGQLTLRCHRLHELPVQQILPAAPAGDYVGVTVADSGCGISPENLSRIFEPFFTTKAFSTRHGTGLGLSMVYEFCKELGYGLAVRSELNRGTSFTIIVPALRPAQGTASAGPAAKSG